MKKVLILGGNGFIGKNLCQYMMKKGEEVYSFDIDYPDKRIDGVSYLQGDFFDDAILEKIIADKDVVIHAICSINPGNSNDRYMQGYERDYIQTVKLCNKLANTKAKLIFLSSGGTVYGNQKKMPITEDAACYPINHYGNLKLCIENTMKVFNRQIATKMLIARISNPYGPGQDYHKGVGFIDAALKKMVNNETIEVWGDGSVIRDYIYIEDVCRMLYNLVYYDGREEVFNISSNTGTSQNQIIDVIRSINASVKVKFLPARTVDASKIILDNRRILDLEAFELVPLDMGIQQYFDYIVNKSSS